MSRIQGVAKDIRKAVAPRAAETPEEVDGLNEALRTNGVEPSSVDEALRLHSNGWRVFVFHEMDDEPTEAAGVDGLEMIQNTAADRILMLPPGDAPDAAPEVPRPVP